MDDYKSIYNSIRLTIYEKATSPLVSGFVVAWSIINFKFWLIFFSNREVSDKIGLIDSFLSTQAAYPYNALLIWYPLLISLFYVLGYPYVCNLLVWLNMHAKRQANRIKSSVLEEELVKATELEDLKKAYRKDIADRESEIDRKKSQISALNQSIAELQQQNNSLKSNFANMSEENVVNLSKNEEMAKIIDALQKEKRSHTDRQELFGILVENSLINKRFKLFHNPKMDPNRSKELTFRKGGVLEGDTNSNEASWRVEQGYLEILNSEGKVHNRFRFNIDDRHFRSLNSADVQAIIRHQAQDQYLIPISEDNVTSKV